MILTAVLLCYRRRTKIARLSSNVPPCTLLDGEFWHSQNIAAAITTAIRGGSERRVCLRQTSLIDCTFSFHCKSAAIRQSSPFDKGCGCRIYRKVYFKRYKWHRLKTLRVCLSQTSLIDVCAFCARMQQSPKLKLCSTVAF